MKTEDCIFFQLAKASQTGTRFWARQVSRFNVTAVQAMVINFLYDMDRVTAVKLGKQTRLDSATLTGIIDRLTAAGLVERLPHPHDRRAILVCLTTQGRLTASELHRLMEAANRVFLGGLSPEEQKALRRLLGKIQTHQSGDT